MSPPSKDHQGGTAIPERFRKRLIAPIDEQFVLRNSGVGVISKDSTRRSIKFLGEVGISLGLGGVGGGDGVLLVLRCCWFRLLRMLIVVEWD